jgi:type IV pilus assembly protein PilB
MGQRLVRKLCPKCKEKIKLEGEQKTKIEAVAKSISPKAGVVIPPVEFVYKAKGCPECSGIGYKGRTTVSEILVIDKDVKQLIAQNALSFNIRDKAIENGMITMQQDGYLKVLEGETTMEEVERVTVE